MDLHQIDWENVPWEPVREGITRKAFSGNGATVALHKLMPKHEPKPHARPLVGRQPPKRLDVEERRLTGIGEDRDDQAVEDVGGPADDVEVAVGDGVERPWADRLVHPGSSPQPGPGPASSTPAARPYQRVPSP